jgi:hypothetical protein
MMAAHHKECGDKLRAIKHNGVCFFLDNGLSNNAKLIYRKKTGTSRYTLGVALVTLGCAFLQESPEFPRICRNPRELLSKEEQKKAFASLMFLKEKRDTTVKAQMCTDRQGQCGN